jgi:hypothetical protein
MSKAAKSVFVFGIYLIFIGLGFLLVPNTVLGLLGFPMTTGPSLLHSLYSVWLRQFL